MLEMDNYYNISYSVGDNFDLIIGPDDDEVFSTGDTMSFAVYKAETETPLFTKTVTLTDGEFEIVLTENEISKLPVGNYYYKIKYVSSGITVTQISGNFIVKWGA